MPFFEKVEDSRNSHEMRLFGLPGMGVHTSSSLRTYTANIGYGGIKFPMYASMFRVTLAGYSTSFWFGATLDFMMLT